MSSDEITTWPARRLAETIARGELSPVEVVHAHLDRIAADETNAVVTIADDAIEVARAAEADLMRGNVRGPLHGVPFTVKDVIDTARTRTTAGSILFRDTVPIADAEAVDGMRRAGAILLGKTNCPEFALEPQTANRVFGTTVNPHDLALGPGGSSGGCAAAVANGLTPLSLGSDYGGSVRFPAHCTGVFGLRPTPGRIPAGGQRPRPPEETPRALFSLIGPLARTPDDLELALDALTTGSFPLTDRPPNGEPMRCAWTTGEGTVNVRVDLAAAVERAAGALVEGGREVERIAPPGLDRAQPLFGELRQTDDYADLAELARGQEGQLTPRIRSLLEKAPAAPELERRRELLAERDRLRARVVAFLDGFPILLLPVAVVPAFPTGSVELDVDGDRHVVDAMTILAPCRAVSLLGLPAMSVPAGTSRDGLPVGVQVVGRPGREDDVLRVAAELEIALGGWREPRQFRHSTSRTLHGVPHSSTS